MIGWDGAETEILLNPRLPAPDADAARGLIAAAGPLDAHVWLTTSGAGGRLKPVALSKRALLASAAAVNAHLEATPGDVWLNPLPPFHVGGLGIHARAHLSGARVETLPEWRGAAFIHAADAAGATLSSLVPTQVVDLLRGGFRAPRALRAVVLGGGALAPALYARARSLGWPLLPSYGATECASQAATAALASLAATEPPSLRLLPHLAARAASDGRVELRGASLFTGYATPRGLHDPKRDGWWRTEDLGRLDGEVLTVVGRADDVVKVLGESVALGALQQTLEAVMLEAAFAGDAALYAVPDERAGATLRLACAGADRGAAERLRGAFNERVAPYERVSDVVAVGRIPRTELGKVVRSRLTKS